MSSKVDEIKARWPADPTCPNCHEPMAYAEGASEAHVPAHWYCPTDGGHVIASPEHLITFAQIKEDIQILLAELELANARGSGK